MVRLLEGKSEKERGGHDATIQVKQKLSQAIQHNEETERYCTAPEDFACVHVGVPFTKQTPVGRKQ